jgi:predicted nucleic-acid-binding Zn-ribbon protein
MKQSGKCPKCGSKDIIADAKAIDRGESNAQHDMAVATFEKPEALIFKGKHQTTVSAWVCAACGFVEFYADSPRTLKQPRG